MAFNGSGCSRSTSGTAERGVKKTPWTSEEDSILKKYVKKHGERNWGLIQKKSILNKSGKSCRNRWANYLRPNLKKGSFSAKEEKLIIGLHRKLGNKWARIASQLTGRTDNEVKNFWNIRLKKCQLEGLTIHPQEMSQNNQPLPLNSSPLPTFSPLSPSFQHHDPNLLCFSDSVVLPSLIEPLPNMLDKSYSAKDLTCALDSNGGMASNEFGDYVIATPNNGAGDFVVMESDFVQGQENKEVRNCVRSLEELWRLLDAPLSVPIPEWDDLDPFLF